MRENGGRENSALVVRGPCRGARTAYHDQPEVMSVSNYVWGWVLGVLRSGCRAPV